MMTRLIRGAAMTLVAVSLTIATSSVSQADPVAATRWDTSSYNITLTGINGGAGSKTTNLAQFWSKISDSGTNAVGTAYGDTGPTSGEFRSYCIDLNHNVVSGFRYAENSVSSDPHNSDLNSPEYFRDLGKAGWLVNTYSAGVDTGAGWTSTALTGLSIVQRAAALQGAVWYAAFGATGFTVSNDGSSLIANAITQLIANLGGNSSAVGFIDFRPNPSDETPAAGQDQVFAVPEPSTFAIAGLGALAFAGHRLRRRRSS